MATEVIHEHTGGDSSSTGVIVGVLLVVLFALLVFYFLGTGFMRSFSGTGTNVQIPDKVDVNVQGGQTGGK